MGKTLGIIGGMGPLATVNLFKKIVLLTDARCDQDHLNILIYNNTSIPDRTDYLIGSGEDPTDYLIESARKLESMGADYLIMPCNTAHYFYDKIVEHISIPFLNMIEETAKYITKEYPLERKVGLLATEGTCKTGVYNNVLNKYGIDVIKPTKDKQKHVTDLIYDIKKGKANISLEGYYNVIDELKEKGVNIFILGCTELSVAYEMFNMEGNFVDPVEILAKKAIGFAGKKVKGE